jgi:hypothetical protein
MKKARKGKRRTGRATVPITLQEAFVLRVYRDMDRDLAEHLDRLREDQGVEPTCRKGCWHCCRQPIPATLLEVYVVVRHVKRTCSPAKVKALRTRTAAWLTWQHEELPGHIQAGLKERSAIHEHAPPCPLLVDNECCAYSARPAICRQLHVISDPRSCRPRTDPEALSESPEPLECGLQAQPHVQKLRHYIEGMGLDFWESVNMLPRWLAAEMGWRDLLRQSSAP